jgi:hypothetical protein
LGLVVEDDEPDLVLAGGDISGEVMTGFAGAWEVLEGDSASSLGAFLNFCDDFRGGGLGGKGLSLFFFFFFFSFVFPSSLTVEFDEEDNPDSLKIGKLSPPAASLSE